MNSLEANIRDNTTKGLLSNIRNNGNVPAIIYGGKDSNQKISVSKKILKSLIEKKNFLSNIIELNIDGKKQNVLPREIKYDIISDEPSHVDFLRVLPGVKIKIEVPVVEALNYQGAIDALEEAGLVATVSGNTNGLVRKQLPRKGEFLEPEGVVELTFDE